MKLNFETPRTRPNNRPDKHLKKLINEACQEQNLKLQDFNLVLKDELNFKLYPSKLGKSTLVIPSYLTAESLDDLKSSYLNGLLKREYGVELQQNEDWFSEEGKQIVSSFLLTDNAKKFLISQNLHHLKNHPTFTYYYLAVITIYVCGQFTKWHKEIGEWLASKKTLARRNEQLKKPSFFLFLLSTYRKSTLALVLSSWTLFCMALFYGTGVMQSRNSDAMTLSRSLANGTTIRSRTKLIDFNYYSGGEEAYQKILNRNRGLNRLFYDGLKNYERILRRIPFDEDGNELMVFSNQLPTRNKFDNLNEWEIHSGC